MLVFVHIFLFNNYAHSVLTRPCRRFSSHTDVASSLVKSAPESCTVYVISRGKLQTVRSVHRPQTPKSNATCSSPKKRYQTQLSCNTSHDAPHDQDITSRYDLIDNLIAKIFFL